MGTKDLLCKYAVPSACIDPYNHTCSRMCQLKLATVTILLRMQAAILLSPALPPAAAAAAAAAAAPTTTAMTNDSDDGYDGAIDDDADDEEEEEEKVDDGCSNAWDRSNSHNRPSISEMPMTSGRAVILSGRPHLYDSDGNDSFKHKYRVYKPSRLMNNLAVVIVITVPICKDHARAERQHPLCCGACL